jgi:hypothetical protein
MMGILARRVDGISHHGERLDQQLVCPATKRRYRGAAPHVIVPISLQGSTPVSTFKFYP